MAFGAWNRAAFRAQRNDPVSARVVRAAFVVTPRQGVSYVISIRTPYSQYRKPSEMRLLVRGAVRARAVGIQLSFSRARLSYAIVRAGLPQIARARVRVHGRCHRIACALI